VCHRFKVIIPGPIIQVRSVMCYMPYLIWVLTPPLY
jgi:hypothetical protein